MFGPQRPPGEFGRGPEGPEMAPEAKNTVIYGVFWPLPGLTRDIDEAATPLFFWGGACPQAAKAAWKIRSKDL